MVRDLWPMWIVLFCIFPCHLIEVNRYIQFLFLCTSKIQLSIHNHSDTLLLCQRLYSLIICSTKCNFITFWVNTLCDSLLNLCCGFDIVLLFSRHSLQSWNFISCLITYFYVSIAFLSTPSFIYEIIDINCTSQVLGLRFLSLLFHPIYLVLVLLIFYFLWILAYRFHSLNS